LDNKVSTIGVEVGSEVGAGHYISSMTGDWTRTSAGGVVTTGSGFPLMVGFEQVHMTNPFGLAAVWSGNDVVHWAQLLLHGIWAMVLGTQGLPWHGH